MSGDPIYIPESADERRALVSSLAKSADDETIAAMLSAILSHKTGAKTRGSVATNFPIRFNPADRVAWERKAAAAGMKLAPWCRMVLDVRTATPVAKRAQGESRGATSTVYHLRASDDEQIRWRAAADEEGLEPGPWARNALNAAAAS